MKQIFKTMLLAATLMAGFASASVAAPAAKAPAKAKTATVKNDRDGKITHLTKDEFNKYVCNIEGNTWKYLGDKPCVIDFYATWCGPCKMISPYLEDIASTYEGKLYVYKIDVDKEKELAKAFGAYSIPLLIFVPMEGDPQSQRGALPKDELEKAVRKAALGIKD